MIDLRKAKESFAQYVKAYDPSDEQIALKIQHTYYVMENSMLIAQALQLEDEQVKLAGLIGLLHDIGRFEQVRRYHTFHDADSINHAACSVEVLKNEQFLRSFIEDTTYDELIYTAIYEHNRYQITPCLPKETELHAKLIRDSDKLDIYRVAISNSCASVFMVEEIEMETSLITPVIYEDFLHHQSIQASKRKTPADRLLSHVAFLFDMNFDCTMQFAKERNLLPALFQHFTFLNPDTIEKMIACETSALTYIDKHIKRYADL